MKIVMTLVARNEADILDAHLAFHLSVGVDFVVAIDNGSTDETTEILERYARSGHVHVTRDDGDLDQREWVTRLARRAATEFGADWVINSDADEFWWPRGGSLKDVFAAVPTRFGSVRGMWRHFVPRPFGDAFFAERMTVRVCNPGSEDNSPYSPRYKTAHRGDPAVVVLPGNHRADGERLEPLPAWYPIDVLHFPIRSFEQFAQKYTRWWALGLATLHTAANEAGEPERMPEFYDSYVVDDDALEHGVADGTLAVDTRLRDALRALRTGRGLTPADAIDAPYLLELEALEQSDPHMLAERKAENLEARLSALERNRLGRVLKGVAARARPGS